jgi:branched-chain amino acid transport system substrate-binding protein
MRRANFVAAAVVVAAAPAMAQAPVKIGVLTEMSGPLGTVGTYEKDGFLLYLQQHNGKLGGVPVEAVVEDTASDANTAILKVKKLVESDGVKVIVGPLLSADAMAIKPYITQTGMPTLVEGTLDDLFDGGPIFGLTFQSNPDWYLAGYLAGVAGHKKAVAIAPNYSAGQAAVEYLEKGFAAKGGTVVQKLMPRLGTADFGPFIGQISSDADAGFALMIGGDAIRFMKQWSDYGEKLPLYGQSAIVDESLLPAEGKSALGFVGENFYFATLDTPANKAFEEIWGKAHPGISSSWYAVGGYTAGLILDQAVTKVGGKLDDKTALAAAIAEAKVDTPAGPFSFSPQHAPVRPRYIDQIRDVNGKIEPVVLGTISEFSPQPKPPTLPAGLKIP